MGFFPGNSELMSDLGPFCFASSLGIERRTGGTIISGDEDTDGKPQAPNSKQIAGLDL